MEEKHIGTIYYKSKANLLAAFLIGIVLMAFTHHFWFWIGIGILFFSLISLIFVKDYACIEVYEDSILLVEHQRRIQNEEIREWQTHTGGPDGYNIVFTLKSDETIQVDTFQYSRGASILMKTLKDKTYGSHWHNDHRLRFKNPLKRERKETK